MSKVKKYNIQTIQDILEAVEPDKTEYFLVDFGNWLRSAMHEKKNPMVMIKKGKVYRTDYRLANFIWIDDGKHLGDIRYVDETGKVVAKKRINYEQ